MKNIMFVAMVALLVSLFRINLPEASLDSMLVSSDASSLNKAVLKTAKGLGLVQVEFSDYFLFRTANLQAGNKNVQLVGIPFVGWGRL
jgi:hypothetical protein